MNRRLMLRLIQIAAATLTAIALVQELNKPVEKRQWHGSVLLVPYDFRFPTSDRIRDTFWNPYEKRIFVPIVFGLGWTINFFSFFEVLGIIHQPDASEETFLLPNKSMKQILRP